MAGISSNMHLSNVPMAEASLNSRKKMISIRPTDTSAVTSLLPYFGMNILPSLFE